MRKWLLAAVLLSGCGEDDGPCPPGAQQVTTQQPRGGVSVECERSDGLRHGPYTHYGPGGEVTGEGCSVETRPSPGDPMFHAVEGWSRDYDELGMTGAWCYLPPPRMSWRVSIPSREAPRLLEEDLPPCPAECP